MLLRDLIKNSPTEYKQLRITGLANDSKSVKKGNIFFALRGRKFNGEKFITEATKNGASLVICSKRYIPKKKFKLIKVNNVRNCLSNLSAKFYKHKPKNIIAVTGTNGKTSVADYFYQILSLNKMPVASIGTLGVKSKKNIIKTSLTSPDIITIHKVLEKLKKNKIDNVIIEASSHGLIQNRLDNINYKAGIFTSFSHDHLDYHKSMKAYFNAKLILFKKLLKKDQHVITHKELVNFSVLKKIILKRHLKLLNIKPNVNFERYYPKHIFGKFQKNNLAMSIIAAKICGLKDKNIKKVLNKIKQVDGRLELVKKFPNNIKVYIDYAHTPDALSSTIQTLKKLGENISLVFGCGGERDFKKRPLMAKIAKLYCSKIYVTDDNPRNENPKKIRDTITKYLAGSNYYNIGDRSKAIKLALNNAKPNEIILVAGKGHENLQDYGKKTIKISDKKIIKNLKINLKILDKKEQDYFFNSNIINKILKNKKFYKINGLALDSRDVIKENLFLAYQGKNNDGNNFITKAFKRGASFIVSTKNKYKKTIKVKNVLNFLYRFAKLKRENCYAKIIAITGSAGKTSLKDMIYYLLKNFDRTHSSLRSFNNHFGVPITLSNLKQDHKYGVIEVGMSKSGEIDKLSKLIKPDLAIITNVAEAHIENFKDINEIAKAKGEIIDNIKKKGTIILNHDDKFYNYFLKKARSKQIKIVSFGTSKGSDIRLAKSIQNKKTKTLTIRVNSFEFKLNIKNINVLNVLASIAVLKELKLDLNKVITPLENIEPTSGRGKIHNIFRYGKKFKFIDESYNANPISFKHAINSFTNVEKNHFKKYLLIGDMLELGSKSEIYHKQLAKLINRSDIDKVFVMGEKTIFTYQNLIKNKRGNMIQCDQDIDLILKNIITNKDYLMIKGSNATGLNIFSKKLIAGN